MIGVSILCWSIDLTIDILNYCTVEIVARYSAAVTVVAAVADCDCDDENEVVAAAAAIVAVPELKENG